MSATKEVTIQYGRFFINCGRFAISPYTRVFFGVASDGRGHYPDIIPAALIVGFLTFAIPLLPALFAVTSALAAVAVSLAIASMFILYPCALVMDACDTSEFSI